MGKPEVIVDHTEGGEASSRRFQANGWAWSPDSEQSFGAQIGELPSAMFTTYSPPHPLALAPDVADRIVDTYGGDLRSVEREQERAPTRQITWNDLTADVQQWIQTTVDAANRSWWRLDLSILTVSLARYPVGSRHIEHVDMHPGSMQRKLSISVQLSDETEYEGGDLKLRCWQGHVSMPRGKGTAVVFPGWTPHLVAPVESGERWALIVWAWGRPVR